MSTVFTRNSRFTVKTTGRAFILDSDRPAYKLFAPLTLRVPACRGR